MGILGTLCILCAGAFPVLRFVSPGLTPDLSPVTAALAGLAPAPLALAFGAGVLAVFNPCGFALLPAFVSYAAGSGGQITTWDVSETADQAGRVGGVDEVDDGEASEVSEAAGGAAGVPGRGMLLQRLLRGALLGLPITIGFLLVFLVAAGALAAGGRALVGIFPWLGLLVGLALVALGARLLLTGGAIEVPIAPMLTRLSVSVAQRARSVARKPLAFVLRRRIGASTTARTLHPGARPFRAAWGFGLGYGLSSLGCTLPIFLLVVGSAITAGGLGQALLVLGAYGAGMAVVLLGVALVATTLGDVLRQQVLPLLRWAQPISAMLILAAGIYMVVYQVRAGLLIH
jgi:cytochrome c-type biogenesis protein